MVAVPIHNALIVKLKFNNGMAIMIVWKRRADLLWWGTLQKSSLCQNAETAPLSKITSGGAPWSLSLWSLIVYFRNILINLLRLMLWSLNPISGEWSEANLVFKVKTQKLKPPMSQTKNSNTPMNKIKPKHTKEQNSKHKHTKDQNHKILCLKHSKPKHSKHSSYTQPRLIHTYS